MNNVVLPEEYLEVRASSVHMEAFAGVRLQRALRLPKGTPPYNSVRSDSFHIPRTINEHCNDPGLDWFMRSGEYVICTHSSESVTLEFLSPFAYPFAVVVSIGGLDALTGGEQIGTLSRTPQNYITLPCQNWLDAWLAPSGGTYDFTAPDPGLPDSDGLYRPFEDERDRITLGFIPMKAEAFSRYCKEVDNNAGRPVYGADDFAERFVETYLLSGRMRYEQEKGDTWDAGVVHPDPFDPDDWDATATQEVAVTLVRPSVWSTLMKEAVGEALFNRDVYDEAGVPWFEEYAG